MGNIKVFSVDQKAPRKEISVKDGSISEFYANQ